ncbi:MULTISPECIES: hypothetical protein [unclassified Leclercia]|uniref:hypothetical protein n=1 Tax=unclassified Leclercia TaxID=2627398 RepID=UPI0025BE7949|nr:MULTISPECIES: hypothetical protein [unclassified Leclercia]
MSALSILTAVSRFINQFQARKSDQTSEAIRAVLKALHESEKYFICLEKGASRDTGKEHDISNLWIEAAEPVRRVDREFSDWCRFKAKYWLTRDSYTADDIKQLNIGLDTMNRRLHKLMDEES